MNKFMHAIFFLVMTNIGWSQTFDSYMLSVEQNNASIAALGKWMEAEEASSKSGIYPDNPELSYSYLAGSPEGTGDQQELEIIQSFKLPGYYTSKSAVQKLEYLQKLAVAEKEKKELLHQARTAWIDLVWLSKSEIQLKARDEGAAKLLALMNEAYEAGEISKPAYERSRIYVVGIQTEMRQVKAKIKAQKEYLKHLSGGGAVEGALFDYPSSWSLPDLDSLLARLPSGHPEMQVARLGLQQAEQEVEHQKMSSLPSFEAGYKSESIHDQKLQGIQAGISIPLWQNKNTIKHAKLNAEASKAQLLQHESKLKAEVVGMHHEATILKEGYEQMRQVLLEEGFSDSYMDLLQSGQISFSEYLVDAELIWESKRKLYLTERLYFTLLSEFMMIE